jgi:hypothetical protein
MFCGLSLLAPTRSNSLIAYSNVNDAHCKTFGWFWLEISRQWQQTPACLTKALHHKVV